MTAIEVRTAAIAVLQTGLAHPQTLQDLKSTATTPPHYNEVTVEDRFGGELRNSVWRGTNGWRITTRAVSETEDGAYQMRAKARAALEYTLLAVGADGSTPVMFESADPIAEDEGHWSGLTTWTCTTTTPNP